MKLEICKYLKKQGKEFYTECIFVNGSRADVFNTDDGIIYEVLESEEQNSIDKKMQVYPFEIICVKANQKWNEELIQ